MVWFGAGGARVRDLVIHLDLTQPGVLLSPNPQPSLWSQAVTDLVPRVLLHCRIVISQSVVRSNYKTLLESP